MIENGDTLAVSKPCPSSVVRRNSFATFGCDLIHLSPQAATTAYILLKEGRLFSPPASPGLIRSTLAVHRCSRRLLDYVGERQRFYLVVQLVVFRTLGAIAFGIAWPATPPSTCRRVGVRRVVFVLGTCQPRCRCSSVALPRKGALPLLGRAISAGFSVRTLTFRGTARFS